MTIIPVDITDMGSFAFRQSTHFARIFTKLILNFKGPPPHQCTSAGQGVMEWAWADKGYYLEHLEKKYRYGRQCEAEAGKSSAPPQGSNEEVFIRVSSFLLFAPCPFEDRGI